jgi:hypothetical protein
MSDKDELRLKIAELKGWRMYEPTKDNPPYRLIVTKENYDDNPYWSRTHNPKHIDASIDIWPNWPESIEDCYMLEDEIPEDRQDSYVSCLEDEILRDGAFIISTFDLVHSTPIQRCRAYIAWREASQ